MDDRVPVAPRVALVGTGVLGSAVGRRLLALGIPLTVYNRTPDKALALGREGAVVAASPRAAAERADLVLTVVTETAALRQVLEGPGGILAAPGRPLIIDLGTHDPARITALAAGLRETGSRLLEAPVTGSVHDAAHGTLNFLVGGEAADVAATRPFLETLGRQVFHLGPVGSGNTAKLALNLLVGVMTLGLGEALALLRAAGVPAAPFIEALDGSGLASPLYRRVGERYLAADHAPRFSLANLEKDIAFVRHHAHRLGLDPRAASLVAELVADVDPATKARDYSALVAWLAGRR